MTDSGAFATKLATAVDVTRDGVAVVDGDGRFKYVNDAHAVMYGFADGDQLHGYHWSILYAVDECERFTRDVFPAVERDGSWSGRAIGQRGDGAGFVQEVSLTCMPDTGLVCVVHDVSEREQLESRVDIAETNYRNIFEQASEGIFRSTLTGRLIQANPAMATLLGYDSAQALLNDNIAMETELYVDPARRAQILAAVHRDGRVRDQVSEIRCPSSDERLWISENIHGVWDEAGELLYLEGTLEDITARREAEERARYSACHDELTDLPVRRIFNERLTDALARTTRRNTQTGVLFIDIDRFKNINDVFGQQTTDGLLIAVAKRLLDQMRQTDLLARLGGDEFGVIVEDVQQPGDLTSFIQRVLDELRRSFMIDGQIIDATASVGVCMADDDNETAAAVLSHAETAMHQARELGRSMFRFFDPALDMAAQRRLAVEAALRQVLDQDQDQMHLVLQPQVALADGRVIAAEALLRWSHPELGDISPGEFIPIAEQTGLILALGEWVLEDLCRLLAEHPQWGALRVFANVSAIQLSNSYLTTTVWNTLARYGLQAGRLGLEVTESTLMQCSSANLQNLRSLSQHGVALALDDFGTGCSSLTHLRDFPATHLKIDMSFVQRTSASERDRSIVMATADLATKLGLRTVAEGTETADQVKAMGVAGCESVQGHYYARPLNEDDFDRFVGESASVACQLP